MPAPFNLTTMIHPLQYISQAPKTGTHLDAIEQVLQAAENGSSFALKTCLKPKYCLLHYRHRNYASVTTQN